MTFAELRREIALLLRFYAGTLRSPLCRDEADYILAVLELIEELQASLRIYLCERSIRHDAERESARQNETARAGSVPALPAPKQNT